MNAPSTEAPRAAARPAKPTNRRPTSMGDTGAPPDVWPDGNAPLSEPFGSCTPYAKDPAVKWPSTAETAAQATVKMPAPVGLRVTDSGRPSGARLTVGTSNRAPADCVTRI